MSSAVNGQMEWDTELTGEVHFSVIIYWSVMLCKKPSNVCTIIKNCFYTHWSVILDYISLNSGNIQQTPPKWVQKPFITRVHTLFSMQWFCNMILNLSFNILCTANGSLSKQLHYHPKKYWRLSFRQFSMYLEIMQLSWWWPISIYVEMMKLWCNRSHMSVQINDLHIQFFRRNINMYYNLYYFSTRSLHR